MDLSGYFAFSNLGPPFSRWGPSLAEREAERRRDLDEDAQAVANDLWLLRHAGVGQANGAMRRLVDYINRSR
jgi:hypothetical protein